MDTKKAIILGVLFVVLVLVGFYIFTKGPTNIGIDIPAPAIPVNPPLLTAEEKAMLAHIDSKKDMIFVTSPLAFSTVSSRLMIAGKARGGWYFEGDFPVRLVDANGKVLGGHYASADLDPNDPNSTWMTNEFVPFKSEFAFTTSTTATGTLILEKDNPSGLPEHADQLRIPVRFSESNTSVLSRKVNLYYYSPSKDMDASGNIMCSIKGLTAVEREIPITETPIQDTIALLLRGELTVEDKAKGITTEFPLLGLSLDGASLSNGILTLGFKDPNGQTSGGSCRIAILWGQIRATALQFDGVNEVKFTPEVLFQP